MSLQVEISTAGALRHSVLRLSRRLRRTGDLGLTASQISVLTTLERRGRLAVGELTRREQVNKSSTTRIVAKLETAGYVTREIDPADRRGVLITLTDLGSEVLRVAAAREDEYLARQLDALSPDDQELLKAAVPALERLLEVRA